MLRLPYFPTDLKLTEETLPLYEQLLAAHLRQLLQEAAIAPECAVDPSYYGESYKDPHRRIAQKLLSMFKKLPPDLAERIGLTHAVVCAVRREQARRFLSWRVRHYKHWRKQKGGKYSMESARNEIRRGMRRHMICPSEIGLDE